MTSTLDIIDIAGYLGVLLYLASYAALQVGLIRGSGVTYVLMNLIAAMSVLVSLTGDWNAASAMIQVFWIAISVIGLGRMIWLRRGVQLTEDERQFVEMAFPNLPRHDAQRLVRAGHWVEAAPGHVLLTEGEPVQSLYYLVSGAAEAKVGSQSIGTAIGMIGEINIQNGGPATATIEIVDTARLFVLSGKTLRALMRDDPDLARYLENQFLYHSGQK